VGLKRDSQLLSLRYTLPWRAAKPGKAHRVPLLSFIQTDILVGACASVGQLWGVLLRRDFPILVPALVYLFRDIGNCEHCGHCGLLRGILFQDSITASPFINSNSHSGAGISNYGGFFLFADIGNCEHSASNGFSPSAARTPVTPLYHHFTTTVPPLYHHCTTTVPPLYLLGDIGHCEHCGLRIFPICRPHHGSLALLLLLLLELRAGVGREGASERRRGGWEGCCRRAEGAARHWAEGTGQGVAAMVRGSAGQGWEGGGEKVV